MILKSTMRNRDDEAPPRHRHAEDKDGSRQWLLMIDVQIAGGGRRCRAGIEASELGMDPALQGFARALGFGRGAEARLESGSLGLAGRLEAIHAMQRAQEACEQLALAKLGEHLGKSGEPRLALGFHGMREARAAGIANGRLGCGVQLARVEMESLPKLMEALDSIFGPGAWFTHARGSTPEHCFDGPEGMAWLSSRMERLGLKAAAGLELASRGDHRRLRL